MSERDLDARLSAVERAVTDGDVDLTAIHAASERQAEVEALESRVDELESTVEELDAAVQAVRGYAGNVRAVNRDVERRASAALAKAESLETALEDGPPANAGGGARSVESTPETTVGTADRQQTGVATAAERPASESGPTRAPVSARAPTGQGDSSTRSHERESTHQSEPTPTDGASGQRSPRRQRQTACQRGSTTDGHDAASSDRCTSGSRDGGERSRGSQSDRQSDLGGERPPSDRAASADRFEGEGESESDPSTTQFIERVRDAL